MGNIATFVDIRNVLVFGNNVTHWTATTDINAGQVVAINATGVSNAVDPSVAAAGSQPVGVALYDATAGTKVAVAGPGCVVYVNNFSDSVAIDAGDFLIPDDAAGKGMVAATSTATSPYSLVGVALDDIAASSSGRCLITLGYYTYHA